MADTSKEYADARFKALQDALNDLHTLRRNIHFHEDFLKGPDRHMLTNLVRRLAKQLNVDTSA